MREILGERRTNGTNGGNGTRGEDERGRSGALRRAALRYAWRLRWPVVPGVEAGPEGECGCPRADCVTPGAHPADPELLAATWDPRMVSWWWTMRPRAPIILATGGRAPCALSLPALAGARALAWLDRQGLPTGPVVAAPTRWLLLVEPYELPELGELLAARDLVPSSLRFHGLGGYIPLPPSRTGAGEVGWVREPEPRGEGVALPRTELLLDALIEAGRSVPDPGSRLAY
ncbi:bifunctional DNA primase/polymerase [Streptomyces hoynatensis]|uniref:DNA primase n=1 Tax=Streptomyces hoynatensis TaxID=1141874 RepID=A0A3A9YPU2_9ACTN|nr:bifunctional DNA primase/polymerase [Streptomyces hoynatensis]RKN38000.1 DNA primase [Streptomyces hoynatensis]